MMATEVKAVTFLATNEGLPKRYRGRFVLDFDDERRTPMTTIQRYRCGGMTFRGTTFRYFVATGDSPVPPFWVISTPGGWRRYEVLLFDLET